MEGIILPHFDEYGMKKGCYKIGFFKYTPTLQLIFKKISQSSPMNYTSLNSIFYLDFFMSVTKLLRMAKICVKNN